MAREAELVGEFRGIVETVVQRQADEFERSKTTGLVRWSMQPTRVKAAGLIFRTNTMPGADNDLWEVETQTSHLVGRNFAHIAIASFASQPDSLTRKLVFDGYSPDEPPTTIRELVLPEIEHALRWIVSPHLAVESMEFIATLTEAEMSVIQP